jgi:hypothetical protein
MAPSRPRAFDPPPEFSFRRKTPVGRHRLLDVFPRFDRVPPFASYPAPAAVRGSVVRATTIEVVRGPVWMYVAPHRAPPFAKEVGWKPVTARGDRIVIGRHHLARSPPATVYLDLLHELYHVFQRRAGRDLWDISNGYAGSPTEIEAYRFAIGEARRLGASERFLREYLRVDWIDAREHRRLLENVGVSAR